MGVARFLAQGRLLLADDMGLGKTVQAIAASHALFGAGIVKRGLLFVPATLKNQWLRECRRPATSRSRSWTAPSPNGRGSTSTPSAAS